MKQSTAALVESVLKSDDTINPVDRKRMLKRMLDGDAEPETQNRNGLTPRVYSFDETRAMLGNRSRAYVHQLCQRNLLVKFKPKGNQRAIGITGQSLTDFIEGNNQTTQPAA